MFRVDMFGTSSTHLHVDFNSYGRVILGEKDKILINRRAR